MCLKAAFAGNISARASVIRRMERDLFRTTLACASLAALAGPASASPWAEVGDNQLRADIEILAAAGVIDGITSQWPLPWNSLYQEIRDADLSRSSDSVRAAAARLLTDAQSATKPGYSAQIP